MNPVAIYLRRDAEISSFDRAQDAMPTYEIAEALRMRRTPGQRLSLPDEPPNEPSAGEAN